MSADSSQLSVCRVDQGSCAACAGSNGHFSTINLYPSFRQPLNRLRVNQVFLYKDTFCQGCGGIFGQNRNSSLNDDGPGINTGVDKMNRTTGQARTIIYGLLLRMEAGERRQQCRVNIDDSLGKGGQHDRGDDPHESGQHNQVNVSFLQGTYESLIEIFTGSEVAVVDAQGVDACLPRPLQGSGTRVVADDQSDVDGEAAALLLIDDRLQVGAAAGGQYGYAKWFFH